MNSESSTPSKLGKTDKTKSTVRTISGKAISGSLLSKLKEQIAEKEKERYKCYIPCKTRLELKADREKRKETMPVKHSVFDRAYLVISSVRKTVNKLVDPSLQESSSNSQRDNDTYIALKQALQNRLYDVLLNWNLFCDAYSFSLSFIIDNLFRYFLHRFVMLKSIFVSILPLFFKKCRLRLLRV